MWDDEIAAQPRSKAQIKKADVDSGPRLGTPVGLAKGNGDP